MFLQEHCGKLPDLSRKPFIRNAFRYQRITAGSTRDRLDQLGLQDVDPVKVREIDAADQIPNLQRIGTPVAKEQVKMEAFRKFF